MVNWNKTAELFYQIMLLLTGVYGPQLFVWVHTLIVDVSATSFGEIGTVFCGLVILLCWYLRKP